MRARRAVRSHKKGHFLMRRMDLHARAWESMDFLALLLAIGVILAFWAGYAGVLSPLVGVLSLGIACLTHHRMRSKLPSPATVLPRFPFLAYALVVGVMGFLFFGVQGGYDLSADAAPTLAAQVVGNSIPQDYQPYYDIPFLAQVGMPALVRTVAWVGIPLHTASWGFALMGVLLFMGGMVRFFHGWGKDVGAWTWIPLLLVGTRLPYYNLLVGEYSWLLAIGLGMTAVNGLAARSRSGILLLAATGIVHPYIGALFALFWLVVHAPTLREMGIVATGAGVLALPYLAFQIIPFIGMPKVPASPPGGMSVGLLTGHLSEIGLVPVLLALAWMIDAFRTRRPLSREEGVLVLLGAGMFLLGLIVEMQWHDTVLGPKILTLALIGIVGLGARFLSRHVRANRRGVATALILILAAGVMITSPAMQQYAIGSKATLTEARFAEAIPRMSGKPVPILFLSKGVGKMAQYSESISPDPEAAHPLLSLQLLATPGAEALREQSMDYHILTRTKCTSCISEYLSKHPARYIVVNTREYSPLFDYPEIMRSGDFILYEGNMHP